MPEGLYRLETMEFEDALKVLVTLALEHKTLRKVYDAMKLADRPSLNC